MGLGRFLRDIGGMVDGIRGLGWFGTVGGEGEMGFIYCVLLDSSVVGGMH